MYASPPVGVAGAPRRTGLAASAPVLAICCLLFILFVIAAVIILALIPVYVARNNSINVPTYNYIIAGNNTIPNRANVANIIARALGLPVGSVTVKSVNSYAGKRKRRGFGLSRSRRSIFFNNFGTGTFLYPETGLSGITCVSGTYNGYTVNAGSSVSQSTIQNGCISTTSTTSTVNFGNAGG